MFFNKKNKEKKSCPGQKYFNWAFFIIFFILFILIQTGYLEKDAFFKFIGLKL